MAEKKKKGKEYGPEEIQEEGLPDLQDGRKLKPRSVTADKMKVNKLSAISADIGEVNAGTVTGVVFRTAAEDAEERIEIDSVNTKNQIRFYDQATLFGKLEVYKDGNDGYIGLIAQDDGAGFEVYTGIGASAFSSSLFYSNGGSFSTDGNASNGFNNINGKFGGYLGVWGSGGAGPDYIATDIGVEADWYPHTNNSWDLGTTAKRWATIYLQNAPDVASDRRLKKNIRNIGYGLKEIKKLRPVSFEWKNEKQKRFGFIAQEVLEIIPEIVGGSKKTHYSISPMEVIPMLVKAIQELSTEVERLKKIKNKV